ncbi:DUF938 domain-containing protein [Sphingomonas sp. SFZ2018-12]|uniref:DUF938 domain-containing protein n=1 Tax=Sphingomonas sp. SFZ2018-12 TaxID=2683197 RepID=UPI001F0E87F1|nr:DUF938 domain-containing protein [Sphingomonas sp. SFZ2018-12]MCH4891649.1 DUF938 domain-containing protein [Sphingomonas sp. SFZ2018-12]
MADSLPWIVAEAGTEARKHAPATLRNREPIADALADLLPASGTVLEIASGSGEHVAYLAGRYPALRWQPSDPDPAALASIAAWCEGLKNVAVPLELDAAAPVWPTAAADAIFCANMVHIAPWEAALGLIAGAGRLLAPGAPLILYGPFTRADVPTAPSNLAFDESLRSRDPRWGLRAVEAMDAVADQHGLARERLIEMPANNLMLVWRRG